MFTTEEEVHHMAERTFVKDNKRVKINMHTLVFGKPKKPSQEDQK
ncbi:MAG TPA: hypothetical protein VKR58_01120 [Aquella sp.]|nr:hypothetical protein [Aquella sp.]